MGKAADPGEPPLPQSRFKKILKKIWWLHSFGALFFGVGVMLFARAGLKYADKILIALLVSWLLMFVALRFIVGPANRKPDEKLVRRGVRVVTNYIIKQFYQQMFFFLVPLYASSATWSLSSWNWWFAPILLIGGVLSTLDLVFDHFIMERRWLAAMMYGVSMFGVLNVLVPLVFGMTHLAGLFIAAAATPGAVALLTFSAKTVMSPQGVLLTLLATGGMFGAVWVGRGLVPPAPLAMTEAAVGHGTLGSEECLPPSKHVIRAEAIDGLRCGSLLREPGGIKEDVVHIWTVNGRVLAELPPEKLTCDGAEEVVYRSFLPAGTLPRDPSGRWACTVKTVGGQLVGVRKFDVVSGSAGMAATGTGSGSGSGSGRGSGTGTGSGSGSGSGR